MRFAVLAVVMVVTAALVAGCEFQRCKRAHAPGRADCSYAPGPVTVGTSFVDEPWNASVVRSALGSMGFAVDPYAGFAVTGARANASARVLPVGNASHLEVDFAVGDPGLGYTREEAEEILNGTEAWARPQWQTILAAFENATGWSHDAEPEWNRAMAVT